MERLVVKGLSLDLPGRRLLDDISFQAESGSCLAVVGPSGSGKTTLLNCLCGITMPTSGSVCIDEKELIGLRAPERASLRLREIGMIFQFGELLPELTVLENVTLPLRLMGVSRDEVERRGRRWLACIGLDDRGEARPEVLSGGEVQRVGIARALAHEPRLILADEPTGALDEANSELIVKLLLDMSKELDATTIMATHDPLVSYRTDRVLRLNDGRLMPDDKSGRTMSAQP